MRLYVHGLPCKPAVCWLYECWLYDRYSAECKCEAHQDCDDMCGSLAELLCSGDESIALQTESCACVLGIITKAYFQGS